MTKLFEIQRLFSRIKELDSKINIQFTVMEKYIRRLKVSREIPDHDVLTMF
jgi:hypothetical protein